MDQICVLKHLMLCSFSVCSFSVEQVEQAETAQDYPAMWHAGTLKYPVLVCVCAHSVSYL